MHLLRTQALAFSLAASLAGATPSTKPGTPGGVVASVALRLKSHGALGTAAAVSKSGLVITAGHLVIPSLRRFNRERLLAGQEQRPGEYYADSLELEFPHWVSKYNRDRNRPMDTGVANLEQVSIAPNLVYVPDSKVYDAGFDFAILRVPLAEDGTVFPGLSWRYLPLSKTPMNSSLLGKQVSLWGYPSDPGMDSVMFNLDRHATVNVVKAMREAHVEELSLLEEMRTSPEVQQKLRDAVGQLDKTLLETETEITTNAAVDAKAMNMAKAKLDSTEWDKVETFFAKTRQIITASAPIDLLDARVLQFLSSDAMSMLNHPQEQPDTTRLQIALRYLRRLEPLLHASPKPDAGGAQYGQIVERAKDLRQAFSTLTHFAPQEMSMLEQWLKGREQAETGLLIYQMKRLGEVLSNVRVWLHLNSHFNVTDGTITALHQKPLESKPYSHFFTRPWRTEKVAVYGTKVGTKEDWVSKVETTNLTGPGGSGGPLVISDEQGRPKEVLGILSATAPDPGGKPRSLSTTAEAIIRVLQSEGLDALVRELMGADMMP